MAAAGFAASVSSPALAAASLAEESLRRLEDELRSADRDLRTAQRGIPRGSTADSVRRQMASLESQRERSAHMTLSEEKALLKDLTRLRGVMRSLENISAIQNRIRDLNAAKAKAAQAKVESDAGVREAELVARKLELCRRISVAKGGIVVSVDQLSEKAVKVPKDRIGHFVGKSGTRLTRMEEDLFVAIKVHADGLVQIVGVKEDVDAAAQAVASFCNEKTEQIPLSEADIHVLRMDKNDHLHTIENLLNVSVTLAGTSMWARGQPENLERLKQAIKDLGARTEEVQVVPNGAFLRMLLMQGGAEIQAVEKEFNVTLDLDRIAGRIKVLGRMKEVEDAVKKLNEMAEENEEKTKEIELKSQEQAAAIIGKKGATVREIQQATGVHITVIKPSDETQEVPRVVIRGIPAKLGIAEAAVQEILEKHAKENAVVEFPEDFHSVLFGSGTGPSRIKEIQDASGGAIVVAHRRDASSAPSPSTSTSDTISIYIRGPEDAVANATQATRDLVASLEKLEINVPEEVRPAVIGPKGSIISKLQSETKTSISLSDGRAVIRGCSEDVSKAQATIQEIIQRHERENVSLLVLASATGNLIGKGGSNLRKLREETGAQIDVQMDRRNRGGNNNSNEEDEDEGNDNNSASINGASQDSSSKPRRQQQLSPPASDKYGNIASVSTIRIRAEDPEKLQAAVSAVKGLLKDSLVSEAERNAFREALLPVPSPEAVRRLVGRNGETIRKLEEDHGVQIDVLRSSQEVRVRGKAGQQMLDALNNIRALLEEGVHVKEKLVNVHKRVVAALSDAATVRRLQDETGAQVRLEEETPVSEDSFSYLKPKEDSKPVQVVLMDGPGPNVQSLKQALAEIALGIEHELLRIPESHINFLAQSSTKPNLERLEEQHSVKLEVNETRNQVRLAGKPNKLVAGKTALFALLRFSFPNQTLRIALDTPTIIAHIIGKKGATIKKIQEDFPDVQMSVHRETCGVDLIGEDADAVKGAAQAIENIIETWQKQNISVAVPVECIPSIIGKKGSTIQEIRTQSGVEQIDVDRDAKCVRLRGPEEALDKAKELVLTRVAQYERENSVIMIDPAEVPFLIGAKGASIRAIQEESGARIDASQSAPGTVHLHGPEESIAKARELIQKKLQDERDAQAQRRQEEQDRRQKQYEESLKRQDEEQRRVEEEKELKDQYAQMQKKIDQMIGISPSTARDTVAALESVVPLGTPVEMDTTMMNFYKRPNQKSKQPKQEHVVTPPPQVQVQQQQPQQQQQQQQLREASRVSGSQVMSMLLGGSANESTPAAAFGFDMNQFAASPPATQSAVQANVSDAYSNSSSSNNTWSSLGAPPGLQANSIWSAAAPTAAPLPPTSAASSNSLNGGRAPPGFANPGLPSLDPDDESFYKSSDGFTVRL